MVDRKRPYRSQSEGPRKRHHVGTQTPEFDEMMEEEPQPQLGALEDAPSEEPSASFPSVIRHTSSPASPPPTTQPLPPMWQTYSSSSVHEDRMMVEQIRAANNADAAATVADPSMETFEEYHYWMHVQSGRMNMGMRSNYNSVGSIPLGNELHLTPGGCGEVTQGAPDLSGPCYGKWPGDYPENFYDSDEGSTPSTAKMYSSDEQCRCVFESHSSSSGFEQPLVFNSQAFDELLVDLPDLLQHQVVPEGPEGSQVLEAPPPGQEQQPGDSSGKPAQDSACMSPGQGWWSPKLYHPNLFSFSSDDDSSTPSSSVIYSSDDEFDYDFVPKSRSRRREGDSQSTARGPEGIPQILINSQPVDNEDEPDQEDQVVPEEPGEELSMSEVDTDMQG